MLSSSPRHPQRGQFHYPLFQVKRNLFVGLLRQPWARKSGLSQILFLGQPARVWLPDDLNHRLDSWPGLVLEVLFS
jgi:hypothetical protein